MNSLEEVSQMLAGMDGDTIHKLFIIEDVLKQLPQVDIPVKHYFANGVMAREMTAPAGSLLIGKMHRFSQINIVLKGDISVLTEDGWKRLTAGMTFESPAGIKRAGYTHEETVWTTIIGTNETDIDKFDDTLLICSYRQYLDYKKELIGA